MPFLRTSAVTAIPPRGDEQSHRRKATLFDALTTGSTTAATGLSADDVRALVRSTAGVRV